MAQVVKNPPDMWAIWVRSLSWGDPLEKGKKGILAWRIPWTIESMGSQRVRHDSMMFTYTCTESKKIAPMIVHAGQQRRHRHKEQIFGWRSGRRGWYDLREQHWNIYITMCERDSQQEFYISHREPNASAL